MKFQKFSVLLSDSMYFNLRVKIYIGETFNVIKRWNRKKIVTISNHSVCYKGERYIAILKTVDDSLSASSYYSGTSPPRMQPPWLI